MTETGELTTTQIIEAFFARPCDWAEDAGQDNGCYENMCVECQREFTGHKHRLVCKVCHDLIEAVNSHATLLAERKELVTLLQDMRAAFDTNPESEHHTRARVDEYKNDVRKRYRAALKKYNQTGEYRWTMY